MVRLGVRRESITLIYPGVDMERFRPGLACDDLKQSIGLRDGQRLILSVGRLVRRKGFDQVIRAIAELVRRGSDVHYALVGIGEDQDYLTSLARECGISDRVHLVGAASPEDLPRWYNACDVFIMPNREINGDTEGFGMVFLEAAACARPAIAGAAGGTGAAVVDGVTGYRVDGTDVDALARSLHSLLDDPALAERLGQAGLRRAMEQFSWDAVAARTHALV